MLLRSTVFLLAFGFALGPALAAGCHVDPFRTVFGADTDSHMTVTSGQRCGITMHSGERMRDVPSGGATSTTLDQQAQHGTVTIPSPNRIEYVSQRGYVGPDSFVFERTGESMSRKNGQIHRGTSHYTINVDVVP